MNLEKQLDAYAEMLIKVGIQIKKNQPLVIRAPIEGRDVAVLAAKHAYLNGASDVHIIWSDDELTLMRYEYAPQEVLNNVPKYQKEMFRYYLDKGAGFLSFTGTDPDLLKAVDPKVLQAATMNRSKALEFYSEAMMSDQNPWTVAGVATKSWAKKVYPELHEDEAVEKLWEAIFDTSRVTDDSVKTWEEHMNRVNSLAKKMTDYKFTSLHYRNSLGTDLVVELPKNHLWAGGGSETPEGAPFVANIPTEEVFTLPHAEGVNGTVYATMPLAYNGNVIDKFYLRFENGSVVDYGAETGLDTLKHLLETDKGSKRLGEVALVPYDSPISNRNQLFYNTLFDENASCHLALGRAYPTCLKGTEAHSKDELKKLGVNDSLVHVDFMVGSKDMSIVGKTEEGQEIIIFKDGNWAF